MKFYIVNKSCYDSCELENVVTIAVLDEKSMADFNAMCVEKGKEYVEHHKVFRESCYIADRRFFEEQRQKCLKSKQNESQATEWEMKIKRLDLDREIELLKESQKEYTDEDYINEYLCKHSISIEEKELNQVDTFWLEY